MEVTQAFGMHDRRFVRWLLDDSSGARPGCPPNHTLEQKYLKTMRFSAQSEMGTRPSGC